MALIERDCSAQESERGRGFLVGKHLGVGQAGGVVDCDVDGVPANESAANTVGVGPRGLSAVESRRCTSVGATPRSQIVTPASDPCVMEWVYYRCYWCEVIYRADAREPMVSCVACGGELSAAAEPANGIWATNVLVYEEDLVHGTQGAPPGIRATAMGASVTKPMRELFDNGTPLLVSQEGDASPGGLAVVLHLTDAQYLAAHSPLRVARGETSGGGIRLRLEDLEAVGEGPTVGIALAGLAASARGRSRQLLADPMTPSWLRAISLRVWLADCAKQLPALLEERLDA